MMRIYVDVMAFQSAKGFNFYLIPPISTKFDTSKLWIPKQSGGTFWMVLIRSVLRRVSIREDWYSRCSFRVFRKDCNGQIHEAVQ